MRQRKKLTREEYEREATRSYAISHSHKTYGIHFDEICKAVINTELWEVQMLAIGEGWSGLKQRMYEEFSRKSLERYAFNNLETWTDIFKLGFKRRFRAQAETDKTIVSFEYFFDKDAKRFPISETWDFYDKEQCLGRKIIRYNQWGMSVSDPYSFNHNTEGLWRI